MYVLHNEQIYLRSQNLILLSKWPLMIVFPIPLPATISLQLEPANKVLVPGMGIRQIKRWVYISGTYLCSNA